MYPQQTYLHPRPHNFRESWYPAYGPSVPSDEGAAKFRLFNDAHHHRGRGAPHCETFRAPRLHLPPAHELDSSFYPKPNIFSSHEQLPAELEPLSYSQWGSPQQYRRCSSGDFSADADDLSYLEDQFLDFSDYSRPPPPCSMPIVTTHAFTHAGGIKQSEHATSARNALPVITPGSPRPNDEHRRKWLPGPQDTRTPATAIAISLPSWSSSPSGSSSSLGSDDADVDEKPSTAAAATRFVKDTRRDKPRQPLACFFCRARKIACQRPADPGAPDQTCARCRKRNGECEYPTKSRRGLYARIPPEVPRKGKRT